MNIIFYEERESIILLLFWITSMRLVCVPAYNEENVIQDFVRECLKYSDKVIVCDDGSDDATALEAEKGGAIVIRHDKNKGKGNALRSLFHHAKTLNPSVVVTIDGDGQFLPKEIARLMSPVLNKKADVVIGCRFNNNTEMPSYRMFGNKIIDSVTNMASDYSFRDTQSGFRSYSLQALNFIKFVNDGFGADSEILVNLSSKDLKILEKDVTVLYPSDQKTSTKDPISHSTSVIISIIELIALKHPLKYLGVSGLVLIIIGLVFSIIVVTIFNDTRYFSVPSTLVAMGSLILGLLLVMLSVILYSITRSMKHPV